LTKKDHISEIISSVIEASIEGVSSLRSVDLDAVSAVCNRLDQSTGKIVVCGVGKSAFVARKMVATLNSTGTRAVFLHAADAMHGDIGVVLEGDSVLLISKSGGTREVVDVAAHLQNQDVYLVGIGNNSKSQLNLYTDTYIDAGHVIEADSDDILPTVSVLGHMAICDAIAVSLQRMKGFGALEFAKLHPKGALGSVLSQTAKALAQKNALPAVQLGAKVIDTIYEISSKRLGACAVLDGQGKIKGIITDGDIRRMLEQSQSIDKLVAGDIMSADPITIKGEALAHQALLLIKKHSINQVLVVDGESSYVGIIHIHDLITE